MKWFAYAGAAVLGGTIVLAGNIASTETLSESVQEVINSNPQIRSQAFNRLGRDEEVRKARAGYLPTLDFMAGAGYENIQEPESGDYNPVEFGLGLRQNVFAGFSTMNEIDRQKARVRSSAYGLQGVSENIALKTARVYLDVLRMEELKTLAERNLLTHQRIADQIKLRSESGVGSKADADQVQGRLSLAESNVVVTGTNLIDAKTSYLAVVGKLPGDLSKPVPADGVLPPSVEDAENRALDSHPTLKSANADLDARKKQHEVASSPFWPRVDIEVDQTWEDEVDAVEERQQSTIAMLRLRYNLFNGFSDDARKVETKQLVGEAREIKNNTARQVVESVRLSWMAYQSVLDRREYLEQHVISSKATAESYNKQFDLGKRTLLDVLDTEAEVIEAERDMINVVYDGLYSQYRVLNGMGGLVHSLGLKWPEESAVEEPENDDKDSDEVNIALN